jgi:D-alanyl-D-alanine carboxypeptidase
MDYESGKVLYEKDGYSKVYPASTTKILTAIIAIENLNLDSSIVCSKNAIYSTPAGSSIMYLKVGEIITVRDLLYGLLLQSGNDAADVLAEAVSGNINDFVILMNKKLQEIGCKNTHFANPHGFHDKDHYTTAYDMAILMKYAMKNETFRKFVETKEIEIAPTNKTPTTRSYTNTNKLLNESNSKMYYEYCIGGKTGYTEEARGTFVGYGIKDSKTVIVSTFDGSQNISGLQARFLDSIKLFDYSFNNFNKNKIVSKDNETFNIKDEKNCKIYTVKLKDDIYTLSKDNFFINSYLVDINFNKITDNLKSGDVIGSFTITTKNDSVSFTNTYDLEYVSSIKYLNITKVFKQNIIKILGILITILFILIILIINRKKKFNKKFYKDIGIDMYKNGPMKIRRISKYK